MRIANLRLTALPMMNKLIVNEYKTNPTTNALQFFQLKCKYIDLLI